MQLHSDFPLINSFEVLKNIEQVVAQCLSSFRATPSISSLPNLVDSSSVPSTSIQNASMADGAKNQTLPGPILMPRRPYNKILLDNPQAVWQVKNPAQVGSPTSRIRQKIDEIRAKSTPDNPICMKCADRGHLARDCPNKQLCFACNRLGHKATNCRTVSDIPVHVSRRRVIQPKPQANLPVISKTTPSSSPPLPSPAPMAFRTPITTLIANNRSIAIEAELMMNFVLDDIAAWGPEKVERILRKYFDQHNWVATVFDEWKYLIKAPNREWLESISARGYLRLENVQFPVVAWDRSFGEGCPLQLVWVRIFGFPLHFN